MRPNMFKRAAALLLALCLLCALLPQTAPAARAANYSGSCGEELTWSFDSRTGKLTVKGSGDMWNFWGDRGDGSNNPVPWRAFLDQITGLSLPVGLTSVGDNAFMDCLHLQAAVIPETVTYIGWNAFKSCAELSEVVLPEGVNEIGAYAFSACVSLSEVVLPGTLEYVYDEAFASCTGLTAVTFLNPCCSISEDCLTGCGELTVYGYDSSTAERFAEEQGLPFVSLGNFTAEGVCGDKLTWSLNSGTGVLTLEGEGDMWSFTGFRGDGYLSCNTEPWRLYRALITGLELPEGLTSIGDAGFNGCWKLKSVVIPENVTRIGDYAFGACGDLIEAVIPEGVTSIGESAFNFCESLPEVTLPASVQFVDSWAFAFCFSLNSITFLNPACVIADDCLDCTENVTVRGYGGSTAEAFAAAQGLRFVPLGTGSAEGVCGDNLTWSFDRDTGTLTIEGSGDMWDYFCFQDGATINIMPWKNYLTQIRSVSLPEGLTYIGGQTFCDCPHLSSITIPDTVASIGSFAFMGSGLTSLTIPASVEYLDSSVFSNCVSLSELTLTEGIIGIQDNCFAYCVSLTSVRFPDSLQWVGYSLFEGCSSLRSVTLNQGLERINYNMFQDCTSLESLQIPDGVTAINGYAFLGCSSLTSVLIPESVTSIGAGIFCLCTSLTSVTLPSHVSQMGRWVFSGCTNLSSVTLNEGLEELGEGVFKDCTSLTSLVIPESVRSIDQELCLNCVNLQEITLGPNTEFVGQSAFRGCENLKRIIIRNPDCFINTEWVPVYYGSGIDPVYVPFEDVELSLGVPGKTEIYIGTRSEDAADVYYDNHYDLKYISMQSFIQESGYTCYTLGTFEDVKPGKYYEIPVAWAYGMGITSGTGEGTFSPNDTCTREQIVTFLYAAAGRPDYSLTQNPFTDVREGKWYYDAVMWAYENGITTGIGDGLFGVGMGCTRAQVVSFLWNAMGSPEPETADCPFTDVAPGKYYYKPVLWAVENGITSGTGPSTFSPKDTCTRAQIVTFLYKAYAFLDQGVG